MKKFLSLLLALVMTMSLVTISAGATEYKDLTDKDELGPQYQEAVAVLNKIGVITGYDDGSFRPDVELTRGAAAKIIVSLLIGPEAANNLPNNYAPYPDVPANHTFAGVISFCKTKGIINGYGDGTFKPANDLTGYAFAKMLLCALGYDAQVERFVDTGWTQNVLSVGQSASLFDRLDFKGSEAVSRKDAALLALNTLKATVVEYDEGLNINVTGENTNVVVTGNQKWSYKTSNQDYATNILPQRRNINSNNNSTTTSRDDYNTVEFAEEHFVDLRLPHDKYDPIDDEFGRPSAEWSYKKLSIGKFPLVPDFEYTTQVIHNVETTTDAAKVRALDLNGYSVEKNNNGTVIRTNLWLNGVDAGTLNKVADIANYTDNGALVQVYVDNNGADFITDVVVIQTQLMEVRKIGSDYVSLDLYDDGSDDRGYGFNRDAINEEVNNVESIDDTYEFLSGLKEGDLVAVIPVAVDHEDTDFDVAEAYTPETAAGTLTAVETYGNVGTERNAVNVTVGGTKYNIAQWNKDLVEIDANSVKVTTKDVTLYLDKYGNTMLAKDVGATEDWMIIGNYRQGIVNGILVTYANGWDIKGNPVSLNVGYKHDREQLEETFPVGSLVYFTNDTTSNTGEWKLYGKDATDNVGDGYVGNVNQGNEHGVFDVYIRDDDNGDAYGIYANSQRVTLNNFQTYDGASNMAYADSGIKFIYVTLDSDHEIDSIEIKSGMQRTTNDELRGNNNNGFHANIQNAQACVSLKDTTAGKRPTTNSAIKAIVIKSEDNAVSVKNLLYVSNYVGSAQKDATGQMVQGYEVAMMGENNKLVATGKTIYSYKTNLRIGQFARYTPSTHDEFEDFYDLRLFAGEAYETAGRSVAVLKSTLDHTGSPFINANKTLVHMDLEGYRNDTATSRAVNSWYKIQSQQDKDTNIYGIGGSEAANMVCLRNAQWLDLSGRDWDIENEDELKDAYDTTNSKHPLAAGRHRDITLTLLFNDNPENDDFRQVYLVVVNSVDPWDSTNGHANGGGTTTVSTGGAVTFATGLTALDGSVSDGKIEVLGGGAASMSFTLTKPEWAYTDQPGTKNVEVSYEVYRDGELWARSATTLHDDAGGITNNGNGTFTVSNVSLTSLISSSDAQGHTITVKLTKVDWKAAKIEYTLNGEAVRMDYSGTSTSEFLTTDSTGNTISFKPQLGGTEPGTYTISGIQTSGLAVEKYTDVTATDLAAGVTTTNNFTAKGHEVVVVAMKSGGAPAIQFQATVNGTAATTDDATRVKDLLPEENKPFITSVFNGMTLGSITPTVVLDAGTTAPVKGGTFWYTFVTEAPSNITANTNYQNQFKVYATITRTALDGTKSTESKIVTVGCYNDSPSKFNDGVIVISNVQGDVDLKVDKVEIVYVKNVLLNAEVSGSKITLTYALPITRGNEQGVEVGPDGGTQESPKSVTFGSNTVTIDLPDNVADGAKLTVADGVAKESDGSNDVDGVVLTIRNTNGAYSIGGAAEITP